MSSRPTVYGFCSAGCKYPIRDMVAAEAILKFTGWVDKEQTVAVEDVDSISDVIVTPNPANSFEYNSAGVQCLSQGTGTLTFSCLTVPTIDLKVNILIVRGISE